MSNCQESTYCKTVSISTFTAQIFLFGMNFEPKMASTGWAGCAGVQESVTAPLLDQRQKTAFGIAELSIHGSTVWEPINDGAAHGCAAGKSQLWRDPLSNCMMRSCATCLPPLKVLQGHLTNKTLFKKTLKTRNIKIIKELPVKPAYLPPGLGLLNSTVAG